ncbi:hypothetical protein MKW98_008505 [Papaver atlanticum]|uniref:Uncharacterized protein n=1 Tax=Papaver atlanticum TaxID=357466 RepID=A0AAD4TCS7_9MAGN|nr:hypothetical protein MKW98_008505 [Papaver atlanticum]
MFNIPKSVNFSKIKSPTDPVRNDEMVVNLYQLSCGLPMPVDSFTSHQMHSSLCFALKRVLSISIAYYRLILLEDIQKFITLSGRRIPGLPWKVFSCECKHQNVKFRLDGFPSFDDSSDARIEKFFDLPRILFYVSLSDDFVDWCYDRDLNANEISAPTHAVPFNQRPGVTTIESDSESYDCYSPKAPEMNSMETDYCQGSSSPFSLIRIPSNGRKRFKRLRKGDQPPPFAFNGRRPKIPLVNKALHTVVVPDAMSGKVCQAVRRSRRLFNKDYTFREASLCGSKGGFAHVFDGNRESTNSGSSDEVLGMNTESSDDNSSGWPSPFIDLGDAEVPSGREAVRGNDISNTLFADDDSSSKDNATTAHDDVLSPGRREPTHDNGEKVIQPSLPPEPLSAFEVFSDVGMMGSGSTNPCPENENVRVYRPTLIPQSDPGIRRPAVAPPSPVQPINEPDYSILLKTMAEHYNQVSESINPLLVLLDK